MRKCFTVEEIIFSGAMQVSSESTTKWTWARGQKASMLSLYLLHTVSTENKCKFLLLVQIQINVSLKHY